MKHLVPIALGPTVLRTTLLRPQAVSRHLASLRTPSILVALHGLVACTSVSAGDEGAGAGQASGGSAVSGAASGGTDVSSAGGRALGGASGSGGSNTSGASAAGGLKDSGQGGGSVGGASGSGGSNTSGASAAGGLKDSGQGGDTTTGGTPAPDESAGSAGEGGAAVSSGGEDAAAGSGGETTGPAGGTVVERHGALAVDGNELLDAGGQPVLLRGQGFGWDNWWPQYYNADVVNWLSDDWCVDVVRPAMGIEPDGAYLADPDASRARIEAVVEAAIDKGVYVIIDWHAHDLHVEEATAFFSEMAQQYGEHPNVIYEVFNEPDEETWPEVKAYAEAVGGAIRQADPDNLIIVGTPEWDQRIDLVVDDPITSVSNVIYAVHFYAATHGDWLRERTQDAKDAGIPVFVSESSGSEASGTGANDYAEWQAWRDFMDANNISWINYSVSDKQGETISVLEPGAPANGGWDASQLTETGEYVREVLNGYCE